MFCTETRLAVIRHRCIAITFIRDFFKFFFVLVPKFSKPVYDPFNTFITKSFAGRFTVAGVTAAFSSLFVFLGSVVLLRRVKIVLTFKNQFKNCWPRNNYVFRRAGYF